MNDLILKEYENINEVIKEYLKGGSNGSYLLKPIFHKNAIVNAQAAQTLFDAIDEAGKENESKARIDIFDISGNIATARVILENWHELNFVDFHHLMKTENGWKIVSKMYYEYQDKPTNTLKDYEDVNMVINKYLKGGSNGSYLLKPIFHKNAVVNAQAAQTLFDAIDEAGKENESKARIDIFDISGNIATARVILENWHGHNFVDFHHLMKTEDGWKIVSKMYNEY
uniref:nuclear transport factor 2 family protein n=1 Tax=Aliarcobacter sp. TaxID=2321116 RepID=UPI004047BB43